jgi:hypothetical protein
MMPVFDPFWHRIDYRVGLLGFWYYCRVSESAMNEDLCKAIVNYEPGFDVALQVMREYAILPSRRAC